MNTPLTDQLREIVDAVTIESPTSFCIGNEMKDVNFLNPITSDHGQYLESPLTHDLQLAIYETFYSGIVPSKLPKPLDPAPREEHLRALRTANTATVGWDQDWRIFGVARDGVYATKGQRALYLPNGFFVLASRAKELKEDELADVRCYGSSEVSQPSFYFGYSNVGATSIGNRRSIRFYWNCQPAGAIEIFRETSERFNRFQVPYEMKCLMHPEFYVRRDSLVMYLKPPYLRAAFEQVKRIYPLVAKHLDEPSPLFTRRLAPGLSMAETPPGNVSFGMHRCGLIARALVQAHESGVSDNTKRSQLVLDEFARKNISLKRPWLDHGEHDPFGIGEFELS